MFHKKYRVKSSTALKGSERKKLRSLIQSTFAHISEDDMNTLLPPKGELTQSKVLTSSGDIAMIYSQANNPLFFMTENHVFPTVYTLWKYPNILHSVTTVPFVMEKISNGADLMAPGVVVDDTTIEELKNLKQQEVCAVKLVGNKAPVAVGIAGLSGEEISVDGCKGKAVLIKHCYRDNLWSSGEQSDLPFIPEGVLRPLTPESEGSTEASHEVGGFCEDVDDEINKNVAHLEITQGEQVSITDMDDTVQSCASEELENCNSTDNNTENIESSTAVEYSMDDVLKQCFMTGLKVHGRKIELPLLTSTFYKSCVLSCCPEDLKLDIKKSSYKKLSAFLKEMVSEGLISVKELSKGVESIVSINTEHEKLVGFCSDPKFRNHVKKQKAESTAELSSKDVVQDNYKFPEIVDLFVVTGAVKAIFEPLDLKKGDAVTSAEVRDLLRNYVRKNSLVDETNPRLVQLDPVLADALLGRSENRTHMTWEELHQAVISKMSVSHKIIFEGEEPKLKKGRLDPVEVTVATRTGNKKVTLITNLENFGIKPEKLAHHVQVTVAASTSISQVPSKGSQVLIQGNQLRYLHKLFFETYRVPRKYVKGLDNISTKKK